MTKNYVTYWAHTEVVDNQNDPLSRIPENLINENDEVFTKESLLGLPDWFKNTAAWWTQGKITDKEFKKNVEYLIKSGIVNPQMQIFQELVKSNNPASDATQDSTDNVVDSTPELANEENPNVDSNENKGVLGDVKLSIEELVKQVDSFAESGAIESSDSDILLKELNTAIRHFDDEKTNQGCNKLESFTSQLDLIQSQNRIDETSALLLSIGKNTISQNFC